MPSVWTVNGAEPPTDSVARGVAGDLARRSEVKVMVHWPDALVFAPASVQVPVGASAPRRWYRSA